MNESGGEKKMSAHLDRVFLVYFTGLAAFLNLKFLKEVKVKKICMFLVLGLMATLVAAQIPVDKPPKG
jgi:hypothetical protein